MIETYELWRATEEEKGKRRKEEGLSPRHLSASPPLSPSKPLPLSQPIYYRKTITFAVVDPKVPPGDYGSADFPSALSVENYAREVGSSLLEKDAVSSSV